MHNSILGMSVVGSLVFGLASPARAGDRLADQSDSLRAVMGLTTSMELEELSGANVAEFRLYTTPQRSRIAWWGERALYAYTFTGDNHEQRAAALLATLQRGSLVTYVAERTPKRREGGLLISEVKALQISAALGAQ